MLKGEALMESSSGSEECIVSLSIADLPTDPCARFARLFAVRPRWELPELEPYLADLQVRLIPNFLRTIDGVFLMLPGLKIALAQCNLPCLMPIVPRTVAA